MAFDPSIFAAEVALGFIQSEEMPARAQEAMVEGYEGDAIVRMAILERPSGWEVDQILPRMLEELRATKPTDYDAAVLLTKVRAQRILDSGEDPLLSTSFFSRFCTISDYAPGLFELAYPEDVLYGASDDELRELMRECAAGLVDEELGGRRRIGRAEKAEEESRLRLLNWPYVLNSPGGRRVFCQRWRDQSYLKRSALLVLAPVLLILRLNLDSWKRFIAFVFMLLSVISAVRALQIWITMRSGCKELRRRHGLDV